MTSQYLTKNFPGIRVDIIGDSGPFSLFGRSISYRIFYRGVDYLIDCGAPVFEALGLKGVEHLKGLICTHSHDDHKRWFSDMALFRKYACSAPRLRLLTTETIQEEFWKNSRGALERTLSYDSKQVVEVPYDEFVEAVVMGPRARYRMIPFEIGEDHTFSWRVIDENGVLVPPTRAKVVLNHKYRANRPRMIFKDEKTGHWIEPETYYDFSQTEFYEENRNDYIDEEVDFRIRAHKSYVWHGPPTMGMEFFTPDANVLFSSDTVYDPGLWHELAYEELPQNLGSMSQQEFDEAHLIYGSINDFIQRSWSEERYNVAMEAYRNKVVVHDVAELNPVVHTEYPKIPRDKAQFMILTHSPDRFVSEFPLAISGKSYLIKENVTRELVGEMVYELDADIYMKWDNGAFVGYQAESGSHKVVERNGMLYCVQRDEDVDGNHVMFVNLYHDVKGLYLPFLTRSDQRYNIRPDGQVEKITMTATASRGDAVTDLRPRLSKPMRLEDWK